MIRLLSTVLLLLGFAVSAAAQGLGQLNVETGGRSHLFVASGTWEADAENQGGARRISIWAEHADGTTILLDFVERGGHADDILFRFTEPATAEFVGREWSEAQGFRVTLTALEEMDEALILSGRFRGNVVESYAPGSRGRVQGAFSLRLVPPIYPPG